MKLFCTVVLLCFVMFSCKKNIEKVNTSKDSLDEKVIKNQGLDEIIKKFITSSPVKDPAGHTLIYFYVEDKDTVLDLIEQPIFDCENFVGTISYTNKDIFLFTTTDLKNRLNSYIDLSKTKNINCDEKIDTSSFYVSYRESFVLKNNLLKQK